MVKLIKFVPDPACIILEYCCASSLDSYLKHLPSPLQLPFRLQLALDISCGMSYLHKKNIFHKDLRTPNILLQKDDVGILRAKISDFGISVLSQVSNYSADFIELQYIGNKNFYQRTVGDASSSSFKAIDIKYEF